MLYAPIIEIIKRARESVILSAKMIGADLLMETPLIDFRKYDFITSPILPGVTAMEREDINTLKLSERGTRISRVRK